MLTLAGKLGFTVIVIVFDVAGEPVKQGDAVEVISTVTISPLVNVDPVKVDAVSPGTLIPFTCH